MGRQRRFVTTALALVLGAVIAPAPAAAAPAAAEVEKCSLPEVYGSYALRACIFRNSGGSAQAKAHVSLEAVHSACVIRGRTYKVDPSGPDQSLDFKEWPCPTLQVHASYEFVIPNWHRPGEFYSAFSIVRNRDGHVGPKAISPQLAVW